MTAVSLHLPAARAACRGCGHSTVPVLDLGSMPIANELAPTALAARTQERFPLALHLCPSCGLLRVGHDVAPERLFRDYRYFSSFADTMVSHAAALVDRTCAALDLGPDDLVLEIASNDGYLLQHYARRGILVLGVDPAEEAARVAERERGVPTVCAFFDRALARAMARNGTRPRVIHAHNVVGHIPDPLDLLRGIAELLRDDGVALVEIPDAGLLLENAAFDTIYHEHYSYFTVTGLVGLCRRAGLTVLDVERTAVHGGSLLVTAARSGTSLPIRPRVAAELRGDVERETTSPRRWARLAATVEARRQAFRAKLAELPRPIWAYGASAKGCVLLGWAGLGPTEIPCVVDRSPHKQGRFVPGVGAEIVPPEAIDGGARPLPATLLLTVWNLRGEVLQQQRAFLERGGRFITAVPSVEVFP